MKLITKHTLTYERYNIEYFYLFNRILIWKRFVVTWLERPKEWTERIKKSLLEDMRRCE